MDALALVMISLVVIVSLAGLPNSLLTVVRVMGIVGLIGLVGLFVAPRLEAFLGRALMRLPLPARLRPRALGVMGQFLLGMRAFQHPGRALSFAGLTVVIWLMDGLGTMVGERALNLPLGLLQALLFLAALGLSSAAPSTPGYVGIYQFVAVAILPLFGFSRSQAMTYIIVSQALYYALVTVWGLLGLWQLGAKEVDHAL